MASVDRDREVEHEARATRATSWSPIFSLSLSVVALILGEMLPASLLTPMASDLHISEGMAGQAVTTTAFVAIFSGLFTAAATRRFDRRLVLLSFAAMLVASNLLVALAVNYPMLLIGRVLLGLGLGGFWSMAAAVSVRLVPPSMGSRALSIIYGGVSVGMVAAIPLGTYLGAIIGWHGVFLGTSVLALIAFVWQALVLPPISPRGQLRIGTLIALLKRPQINIGNMSAFLVYGGHLTFFTYLRPFLERVTGIGDHGIATILLGYGVASIAGTAVSSVMIRISLRFTLAAMPLLMALLALGLVLWGDSQTLALTFVMCWGFAFGVIPVSWATWVTRAAPGEIESANGLRVAGIQMSIAAGAGIGGVLLDAFGPSLPFISAGVVALLAAALVLAKLHPPSGSDVS